LILNHNDLNYRIKTDKKLAKKVELVKKAYFELSDHVMDEEFWRENFIL
jgi:hypothetical protein